MRHSKTPIDERRRHWIIEAKGTEDKTVTNWLIEKCPLTEGEMGIKVHFGMEGVLENKDGSLSFNWDMEDFKKFNDALMKTIRERWNDVTLRRVKEDEYK